MVSQNPKEGIPAAATTIMIKRGVGVEDGPLMYQKVLYQHHSDCYLMVQISKLRATLSLCLSPKRIHLNN